MSKAFRPWEVDQVQLLPPSAQELVPEGHVAHFVRDLVRESLDLSQIFATYGEERGQPPFHPAMMTALLLFAYSQGILSSRKIAQACEQRVDFMAVTAMRRPEHRTICDSRRRHLAVLGGFFGQVLRLCQRAGRVKLGHVALDSAVVTSAATSHRDGSSTATRTPGVAWDRSPAPALTRCACARARRLPQPRSPAQTGRRAGLRAN